MKSGPRSYWTEDVILDEVANWCKNHGVRGYYIWPNDKSLFALFLSPVGTYHGSLGQGHVLYHRSYSRLYALSLGKLSDFFSRENLVKPGQICGSISVGVPKCKLEVRGYANADARPYETEYDYQSTPPVGIMPEKDRKTIREMLDERRGKKPWSSREDSALRRHFVEYGQDMRVWGMELPGRDWEEIEARAKALHILEEECCQEQVSTSRASAQSHKSQVDHRTPKKRKRKASRRGPSTETKEYDPDAAAQLLASKFGNRVSRLK